MLEDLQETMSPFMKWMTLAMVLLGIGSAFVPQLNAFSIAGNGVVQTVIMVLAGLEVLYALIYGIAEGFDFSEIKIVAFSIGGTALFASGAAAITGVMQLLGPLAPLANAFQVPMVAIGASMLLLALGGFHSLTK